MCTNLHSPNNQFHYALNLKNTAVPGLGILICTTAIESVAEYPFSSQNMSLKSIAHTSSLIESQGEGISYLMSLNYSVESWASIPELIVDNSMLSKWLLDSVDTGFNSRLCVGNRVLGRYCLDISVVIFYNSPPLLSQFQQCNQVKRMQKWVM